MMHYNRTERDKLYLIMEGFKRIESTESLQQKQMIVANALDEIERLLKVSEKESVEILKNLKEKKYTHSEFMQGHRITQIEIEIEDNKILEYLNRTANFDF